MKIISSFTGSYTYLSNFASSKIKHEGNTYPTAEHLFQALKTRDSKLREKIRLTKSPRLAKKLGRKLILREDWEAIKENLMYMVVRLKFSQNKLFAKKLIETKDDLLVEGNWWCDNIWGACNCNKCVGNFGENKLGKILMKVRILIGEKI